MTRQFRLHLVACAVPLAVGSAALLAQAPPADPWTQVPAFPTTCFRTEDFSASADRASAALEAAIARQEKINEGIEQEYKKLDMGEIMKRMQAFMMKDPQLVTD